MREMYFLHSEQDNDTPSIDTIVGICMTKRKDTQEKNDPRIARILTALAKEYQNAHIALTYTTPWELLVAVILSAQCTDVMVNKITPNLFARFPSMQDMANANSYELESSIHATGFFRAKAKNIQATARLLISDYNSSVPKTMKEMLTLPGVARKTANVVLTNAYGIIEGIAVDTHVIRLSQRLRLINLNRIGGKRTVYIDETIRRVDYKKDADPSKIEQELQLIIPKTLWGSFTYQLIDHGRAVCKAIKPQCLHCVVGKYCPSKR